jgi:glycosyltransferase involved in cell wall biosynthesis
MSVDDIARCMGELWNDEGMRQRLARNGIVRSERYTWDRTAEALWASFQRMTDGAA